jgi:hypothetical protein
MCPGKGAGGGFLLGQQFIRNRNLAGPLPTPADIRIFRLTPTIVSLLDYSKAFGHTDLVTC